LSDIILLLTSRLAVVDVVVVVDVFLMIFVFVNALQLCGLKGRSKVLSKLLLW